MAANLGNTARTALQLVADNPGRVLAHLRGKSTRFLTLTAILESTLTHRGLIARRLIGTRKTAIGTQEVFAWELTEAGRAALTA